ncbi:Capsular polysaccharide phosphotransferase SacB [Grimontia celer]|uniref:Capsular polysaccharide phosphotransferase SacB n=1 Tax=Grimontia celer TaxID=1796497 RepID=A0A128F1H9_9GAMM|nr:stealth conserved region 3 domain-containing protein [Grimontia celer]CZF80141.1 Capsular polysaccharide phosphotransferase SacB [Grimontia celer]
MLKKFIKRKLRNIISNEIERKSRSLYSGAFYNINVNGDLVITSGNMLEEEDKIEEFLFQALPVFSVTGQEDWNYYAKDRNSFIFTLLSIAKVNNVELYARVKRNRVKVASENLEKIDNLIKTAKCFELKLVFLDISFSKIINVWDEVLTNGRTYSVLRMNNLEYKKIDTDLLMEATKDKEVNAKLINKHSTPITVIENLPVDIVYTWVNDKDEDWRRMLIENVTNKDEIDWDRFHSIDELKYSLRSIFLHAPWVNKIYVLTNCKPPEWLLKDNDKVIFVDHIDVFPDANVLPNFNSHAIESCLHKINGLSENFIYFNDDVFLGRNVDKSLFIEGNKTSKSFLEPYGMVYGSLSTDNPDYLNASLNSKSLIESEYSLSPTQLHKHTPHSLRKSVLEELEIKFKDNFDLVRSAKFRTINDINITSFLYHHYSYINGRSCLGSEASCLVRESNIDKVESAIKKREYDFFCLNDGGGSSLNNEYHNKKIKLLNSLYSEKAPWEI